MLVLSRKLGERIVVPECGLEVTILEIAGKTVRMGISAPEQIGIYREEVWRKRGQSLTDATAVLPTTQ